MSGQGEGTSKFSFPAAHQGAGPELKARNPTQETGMAGLWRSSFTLQVFPLQVWKGRASLAPTAPLHPWNSTHRLWALLAGTGLLAHLSLDVVNPGHLSLLPTHSIPQGWSRAGLSLSSFLPPEQKSLAALPHGTYCSWSCSIKRGQRCGEPAAPREWMGSSKCLQQVQMLFPAPSVSVFNLLLKSLCLPLYSNYTSALSTFDLLPKSKTFQEHDKTTYPQHWQSFS